LPEKDLKDESYDSFELIMTKMSSVIKMKIKSRNSLYYFFIKDGLIGSDQDDGIALCVWENKHNKTTMKVINIAVSHVAAHSLCTLYLVIKIYIYIKWSCKSNRL
jgi:hypothetical protein